MTDWKRASKGWLALVAGLGCGAIVWWLSIPLTGQREPFDAPGPYYLVAMFLAGVVAALAAPRFWWVAVIGIFLGERLYAYIALPETRVWLLFGIVVNLTIFSWLPAALGALSVYVVNRHLTSRLGRERKSG